MPPSQKILDDKRAPPQRFKLPTIEGVMGLIVDVYKVTFLTRMKMEMMMIMGFIIFFHNLNLCKEVCQTSPVCLKVISQYFKNGVLSEISVAKWKDRISHFMDSNVYTP